MTRPVCPVELDIGNAGRVALWGAGEGVERYSVDISTQSHSPPATS